MSSRFLKLLVAGAFVMGASLALALPMPKDIEAAVAAGQYTQAETMLREVLQEKPQSAKAHYELGQVLARGARYSEAQTELKKAKDIDPSFGMLADFDALVARAHELGLKVMIDQVISHSSDQHPLFAESRASREGPKADWYVWADPQDDGTVPNNWLSVFGGPAWEWDTRRRQYYLHNFLTSQPDFNFHNPAVQDWALSVLRFWLDRGVDGFRVDQPHAMAKAAGLPDHPYVDEAGAGFIEGRENPPMWFQEEVHPIFRRWRQILDSYPGDRAMCGEAYVLPLSFMALWVRADEFHQTFNFRFLDSMWEPQNLFDSINESFKAFDGVGAPSTWVLSNHDVIRHASRMGGLKGRPTASDGVGPNDPQPDRLLGLRVARGATMFTLGLAGASYLYQGEELGLPEHTTLAPEYRQDPTYARTEGKRVGRDGCRVPLPWEAGVGAANGFNSTGAAWLPQPDVYAEYSRDRQEGVAGSTLELYKSALRIRRELKLGEGSFEWLPQFTNERALGYRNGDVLVIHNFGSDALPLPHGSVLLRSVAEEGGEDSIRAHETVWVRV